MVLPRRAGILLMAPVCLRWLGLPTCVTIPVVDAAGRVSTAGLEVALHAHEDLGPTLRVAHYQ